MASVHKLKGGAILLLSKDEANMLMAVVGSVSGCSYKSRRKHIDSIYHALHEAGYSDKSTDLEGSMHFKETPQPSNKARKKK